MHLIQIKPKADELSGDELHSNIIKLQGLQLRSLKVPRCT
jgi:hypothetical protein